MKRILMLVLVLGTLPAFAKPKHGVPYVAYPVVHPVKTSKALTVHNLGLAIRKVFFFK